MSEVRIIPCLDIKNAKLVKGKKFKQVLEVGNPESLAEFYYKSGADELVLYDITASKEERKNSLAFLNRLVGKINIPLIVGGGINSLEDMKDLLSKGVSRISINTSAIKNPKLIREGARKYGSASIVLSMDVKKIGAGKWNIFTSAGKIDTGKDAVEWAVEGEKLGAGELIVNSIDGDGMKEGYDIDLLKLISSKVKIPLIASGGAGKMEDFSRVVLEAKVAGLLAASVFHYGEITIKELKNHLRLKGIGVKE